MFWFKLGCLWVILFEYAVISLLNNLLNLLSSSLLYCSFNNIYRRFYNNVSNSV